MQVWRSKHYNYYLLDFLKKKRILLIGRGIQQFTLLKNCLDSFSVYASFELKHEDQQGQESP